MEASYIKFNQTISSLQVLYSKLRGYHWLVKGKNFFYLHNFYQTLYTEMEVMIDDLAERLVALGGKPNFLLKDIVNISAILDEQYTDSMQSAKSISNDLAIISALVAELKVLAENSKETATVVICDNIIQITEKNKWMLNSFLSNE